MTLLDHEVYPPSLPPPPPPPSRCVRVFFFIFFFVPPFGSATRIAARVTATEAPCNNRARELAQNQNAITGGEGARVVEVLLGPSRWKFEGEKEAFSGQGCVFVLPPWPKCTPCGTTVNDKAVWHSSSAV